MRRSGNSRRALTGVLMSLQDKVWPLVAPLLKGMWGHRWVGVGAAWVVCVAGWILVAFLPTVYESTAKVYVNAAPILTPLLKGLAADTDPTRQLDYMRRTLLSRPNLEEAARLSDLDLGDAQRKEDTLKRLATSVRIGFEGKEHTVPVVHGHFLFVAWDAPLDDEPRVLGFVTS